MVKGIIGKKVGMTQLFDANGKVVPVTVIEAGPCTVVQKKTVESDGYQAVQLGFGEVSAKKVNKAAAGHFKKANVAPKKTLREFRLEDVSAMNVGDVLKADVFAEGDKVDVVPRARATRALSSATVSTVCVRATAPVLLLVMQVLTVPLLPLLACSPASACPATWALCASPCRT
jgi:hypothetical protein